VNVLRVSEDRQAAIAMSLDLLAHSWLLRFGSPTASVDLYESDDGGLVAISGHEAKLGHLVTDASAASLGRATSSIALSLVWGRTNAVRSFIAARDDASDWRCVFAGTEMLRSAAPKPSAVPGEMRRASDLDTGASDRLAPPFDEWMRAFVADGFEPGMSPPPVSSAELCVWLVDGEPRTMAGALPRGEDAIRIVTVYTPPNRRNAGYAGALVAAMGDDALARGKRLVTLDVMTKNVAARRAYERAGFRAVLGTERWVRP
jgi:ribosomal protein S18 acetylase RimI-like enzyme